MTTEAKLDLVAQAFSRLPGDKQDYILGILQALAFAHNQNSKEKQPEVALCDSGQNTELIDIL